MMIRVGLVYGEVALVAVEAVRGCLVAMAFLGVHLRDHATAATRRNAKDSVSALLQVPGKHGRQQLRRCLTGSSLSSRHEPAPVRVRVSASASTRASRACRVVQSCRHRLKGYVAAPERAAQSRKKISERREEHLARHGQQQRDAPVMPSLVLVARRMIVAAAKEDRKGIRSRRARARRASEEY